MNRLTPQHFRVNKGRQPCSVSLQFEGDHFVFFTRLPQSMQTAITSFSAVAQQYAAKSQIKFGYVDLTQYPSFAKILEESSTPPGAALYVYYKQGIPRTFHSTPLNTPKDVVAKIQESFSKSDPVAPRPPVPAPQRARPDMNPRGARNPAQPGPSDFSDAWLVSPPEVIPHNRPWQSDFTEGEL
jgi:hypothetical protein